MVLCWHGLANRVGMLFAGSDTDSEAGMAMRGSSLSLITCIIGNKSGIG